MIYSHQFDAGRAKSFMVGPTTVITYDPLLEAERVALLMGELGPSLVEFKQATSSSGVVYGKGHCFKVAHQQAVSNPGLLYCEGFLSAMDSDGVEHTIVHAWNCTPSGVVLDSTVEDPALFKYRGVTIRLDVASDWRRATGYDGMIDGCPDMAGSPLHSQWRFAYWDKRLQLTA